jgi:hypothetical protein
MVEVVGRASSAAYDILSLEFDHAPIVILSGRAFGVDGKLNAMAARIVG